jgi:flagellar motility protein MotE (MotC chaperone)
MGMSPNQHNAYFANKRKEDEERKERNKKFAFMQAYHDQKAHEQHLKDLANVCKKCRMIRNSAKECPYGCPQD